MSAQPAHLLVHQDKYVIPLPLQEVLVEQHPAPGPPWCSEQEFPEFSDHWIHLLMGDYRP
jgi:hypothetical protein